MNLNFSLCVRFSLGVYSLVRATPFPAVLQSLSSQNTLVTTCTKSGQAALTYDDGPYLYENEISDYLHARQIKGTFFVNGNNYACIYDEEIVKRLKRTFSQGHLIGSHTWSHPNISTLSASEFRRQLVLVEQALIKILGVKPKFFRAPYGEHNQQSLDILKEMGYIVVDWSFDSGDSIGTTPAESQAHYAELATTFPTPQITLNHETEQSTAEKVSPYAIRVLQKEGYKLVHVSECLGLGTRVEDLYQWVGKPSDRDSSWTCAG